MFISTSKSNIYIKSSNVNDDIPYFFIHGFTGSSSSWKEIIKLLNKSSYAIDVAGHRKSTFNSIENAYTISDWCSEFYMILNNLSIPKINICGYSMGGRLAIAFASKYPEKISSLILESTSVGIDESEKRSERYYNDKEMAVTIKEDLPSFVNLWEKNVFFVNQKERNPKEWEKQKKIRLSHAPEQLAKALEAFSPSNMPYYERQFQEFSFPISIINGSEDVKFIKLGKDMTIMNNNAKQYIIQDANHNTHLESPDLFIDILNNAIYE